MTVRRMAPIRRSPMRPGPSPKRKAHKDPVKPIDRATVLRRDGSCVIQRFEAHVCRDKWGESHPAWAMERLSIEHVKPELAIGRRGPSEPRWMVACCHWANTDGLASKVRPQVREYLAALYPDVAA